MTRLILPAALAALLSAQAAAADPAAGAACAAQVNAHCTAAGISEPGLCLAAGLTACERMGGGAGPAGDLLATVAVSRLLQELFTASAPEAPEAPVLPPPPVLPEGV
ncbi:hypothetical protein HKCCE2091_19555 [Rhodobacterales bacterium HKCCE2091]|nr:hypothetical protein [Rhodobacterales bacterium HKCCE2091]